MRFERKLTPQQHRSVKRLIRAECSNFYDGLCLMADRLCGLLVNHALSCNWFHEAVLPRDKALQAELEAIPPTPAANYIVTTCTAPDMKRCLFCGQEFTPASNRAKYCSACAAVVRREQKRRHEQQRRNRRRAKENA